MSARFAIELAPFEGGERLRAYEPTRVEVATAARRLAAFYNEPHNRVMLGHTADLSAADVAAHYRRLATDGARAFLLQRGRRIVGDADLRHIQRGQAEVAILVGDRTVQGRGLGTRFAVMVHTFAFHVLQLERLYASIIPTNGPSLRLFEKLGYVPDDTSAARRRADEPDDVTLSLTRERFEGFHGELAGEVAMGLRPRASASAKPRPALTSARPQRPRRSAQKP